jgi:hypothetical protein
MQGEPVPPGFTVIGRTSVDVQVGRGSVKLTLLVCRKN